MEASRIEVCAKMPVKPALWRCAVPALKLFEIFSLATNTKKLFDHLPKTPTFPDSYVRSPTYGTAIRLCQGVAQIKVLSSVFRSMNYLLNCIRSLFLLEKPCTTGSVRSIGQPSQKSLMKSVTWNPRFSHGCWTRGGDD